MYMDDFVIPSQVKEEGLKKREQVLFKVPSEYIIEDGTIKPAETKILVVQKFPEPKIVKKYIILSGINRISSYICAEVAKTH